MTHSNEKYIVELYEFCSALQETQAKIVKTLESISERLDRQEVATLKLAAFVDYKPQNNSK